jgi:DNA-binding CsgD family transcriptional regulator
MDDRAHHLVDRIYAAALDPEVWNEVAEGVSEIFGGSPTLLGFLLQGQDHGSLGERYAVGLNPDYLDRYIEHLLKDVPWSTHHVGRFVDHFGDMSEVLSHVSLADSGLYLDWMKPQGLAPIWPAGHTLTDPTGAPVGGFTIFRREGAPPFSAEEFRAADIFVPHFRRALATHLGVRAALRVREALAEAINLLPTGLLLLDERRRVVLQNRGADRIARLDDGFRIDAAGPSAEDARENATLQKLIADSMESGARGQTAATGFLAISRPSGKQSFAVMVAPLLSAPDRTVARDATVAIFVADPEAGRIRDPDVLGAMYSLTHSEAELVRLLAQGMSLEEVADARGVSVNTARSHLKHVFSKTGTSRQGELVRLVLSGVGSMGEE